MDRLLVTHLCTFVHVAKQQIAFPKMINNDDFNRGNAPPCALFKLETSFSFPPSFSPHTKKFNAFFSNINSEIETCFPLPG